MENWYRGILACLKIWRLQRIITSLLPCVCKLKSIEQEQDAKQHKEEAPWLLWADLGRNMARTATRTEGFRTPECLALLAYAAKQCGLDSASLEDT